MRFSGIVITLALLISVLPLRAQHFIRQFTPNDGLLSGEVYDLAQDSLGRIWFATDNGLSIYDGYGFRTVPAGTTSSTRSIVRIMPGENGGFWFLAYDGRLYYNDRDRLKPYIYNDTLLSLGGPHVMTTIWADTLRRVFFHGKNRGEVFSINQQGLVNSISNPDYPYTIKTPFFSRMNPDGSRPPIRFNPFVIPGNSESSQSIYDNIDFPPLPGIEGRVYKLENRFYFLGQSETLVEIAPSGLSDVSVVDSINIAADGNYIWVRKEYGGVLLYRKENKKQPANLLPGCRVTRILLDREGNYWFTTEGEGVFLSVNPFITVYGFGSALKSSNIIDFALSGKTIFITTNDYRVVKADIINGRLEHFTDILTEEKNKYGRNVFVASNGYLWILQSKYLRYTLSGVPAPPDTVPVSKYYRVIEQSDHSVILTTREGFFIYKGNKLIYDSRDDGFSEHTFSACQATEGDLFFGTLNGLYRKTDFDYEYLGIRYPVLRNPVSVLNTVNQNLIAGLRSGQIALLKKDSLLVLGSGDGLIADNILDLAVESDTVFWAGTNKGLYRVGIGSPTPVVTAFSIWDGLPSNQINSLTFKDGLIWLGTGNGLAVLNPNELKSARGRPILKIESVIANDKDTIDPNNVRLLPGQRTLVINYRAVSMVGSGGMVYRFGLSGVEKTFVMDKNLSVRYTGLKPGRYTFTIDCVNSAGNIRSNREVLEFTIPKYFRETAGFIILAGSLVLVIIILVVVGILRFQSRRAQIDHDLLVSEQKALRLQMNPHFIFNTLNSINNYIQQKDARSASFFLMSFAKLMRKILDYSKQSSITLAEELESLKDYMALERMRFEGKFDFNCTVDPSLNPGCIEIPPMLIQPLLENAIWHGLLPKPSDRILTLEIKKLSETNLSIVVEDNGIGREKAAEKATTRQGHKSTGLSNIEERIGLLNNSRKKSIKFEITDLKHPNGDAAGTKIFITLPVDCI